jgi:hypothetical protein
MHLQLFNAKGDLRGELKYPNPLAAVENDDEDFDDNRYLDVDTTPGLYMRATKKSIVSLTAPVRLTSLVCMSM